MDSGRPLAIQSSPQNATLEVIWEQNNFNNTLAGYFDCPVRHQADYLTVELE